MVILKLEMTKIPIMKDEKGRILYMKLPKDPNEILIVNHFHRDKEFIDKEIRERFVIEDPFSEEKK